MSSSSLRLLAQLRVMPMGWSPKPSTEFQLVTTLGDWGGVRLRLRTQPQQPTYVTFCPSLCDLPVSLRHQLQSTYTLSSWSKSQEAVAAIDGGLCPRGGTTQGRRGQALKKKKMQVLLVEAAHC